MCQSLDIGLKLIVCIVLNGEKIQSHTVTVTLIGQCQNFPSYFHIPQYVQEV